MATATISAAKPALHKITDIAVLARLGGFNRYFKVTHQHFATAAITNTDETDGTPEIIETDVSFENQLILNCALYCHTPFTSSNSTLLNLEGKFGWENGSTDVDLVDDIELMGDNYNVFGPLLEPEAYPSASTESGKRGTITQGTDSDKAVSVVKTSPYVSFKMGKNDRFYFKFHGTANKVLNSFTGGILLAFLTVLDHQDLKSRSYWNPQ